MTKNTLTYWVIKTGANTHIKNYISLFRHGDVGDQIFINSEETKNTTIIVNDAHVFSNGKNAISQMLVGWQAMGLVKFSFGKCVMICPFDEIEDIINYSKIWLLKKTTNERVQKYRYTKIINVLYEARWLTFSDLQLMGVIQQRGTITKEKIKNEILEYEKNISSDQDLLKKMKGIIDNGF